MYRNVGSVDIESGWSGSQLVEGVSQLTKDGSQLFDPILLLTVPVSGEPFNESTNTTRIVGYSDNI